MVISSTSAVDVSIHAVSPLLIIGAAGAGAASAGFASAGGAASCATSAAGGGSTGGASACPNAEPLKITRAAEPAMKVRPNHFAMSFIVLSSGLACLRLECVVVGFAGADAHDLVDRGHENLPVPDLPGAGARRDGFHHRLRHLCPHGDFNLD